jgi:hypothetical protein
MFYTHNLPHVIDLPALAVLTELAARLQTATGAQASPWGG